MKAKACSATDGPVPGDDLEFIHLPAETSNFKTAESTPQQLGVTTMTPLRDNLLDAYGGFADRRFKDRDLDRANKIDDRTPATSTRTSGRSASRSRNAPAMPCG